MTDKQQHTPAPWEVRDDYYIVAPNTTQERWNNYVGNPAIICELEEDISDAYEQPKYAPLENAKANARLIAAAPDLLAALLYMLQCHRETHDKEGEAAYRQSITAINKATGAYEI